MKYCLEYSLIAKNDLDGIADYITNELQNPCVIDELFRGAENAD